MLNMTIFDHIDSADQHTLLFAHLNIHGISEASKSKDMMSYIRLADFHWIDGMPIIFFLKALGHQINTSWRLTFLDWQNSFLTKCNQRSLNVFLLGASERNIEMATRELSTRYPKICFSHRDGYVNNEAQNREVVDQINNFAPDILLVGMGMPKQEEWIWNNHRALNCKVILPLGGYFDYIAGATFTPPRWAGKVGLEWFFRFIAAPKKLAYRYFLEPIPVVFGVLAQLLRKK